MPTSAEAKKIASHKFGRRKLATNSAWVAINHKLKNQQSLRNAVVGDTNVQQNITALNTALQAAFAGIVTFGNQNATIVLSDAKHFLPRSVYFGYIDFSTGSLTAAQRAQFGQHEKEFADAAGLLRANIARIIKLAGILNDMSNNAQNPNPGGVVTGDNTDHYPYNEGGN